MNKIVSTWQYVLTFLFIGEGMEGRPKNPLQRAKAALRGRRTVLRTGDILRLGVRPRELYALRDGGFLEQVARGLYRVARSAPLADPDLATVAARVPRGVICLISALAFHGMTTQVPHEVYLALARGARPPKLAHPPVRVFWFNGHAFSEGIETHTRDGVPVRVYSREKTLADSFKYRRRIGLDVAVEALRLYCRGPQVDVASLLRFARVCRVETVMRPYLESIL